MNELAYLSLIPQVKGWLEEDDLLRNFFYNCSLPDHPVQLSLKIKSDVLLAGVDYFIACFIALGSKEEDLSFLKAYEGKCLKKGEQIEFLRTIPFSTAVTAERLALNLLQHGCSIATFTSQFVNLAKATDIKIIDTRKTTPGLRALEKYSVRVGGGYNHRLGQTDVWMIKDNHKTSLGGLKGAFDFFKEQGGFYVPIIAEIHDLQELEEAIKLGIKHVLLDNFLPEQIHASVQMKKSGMTYEVSGGINLTNLTSYLIQGIDAISIGALTHSAPKVDISLKFKSQ